MKAASLLRETMWSMVSEIHSHDRLRLRQIHGREPRPLREGLRRVQGDEARVSLPGHRAKVVIVGGGIVGCSVAYHLGQMGWSDVLLLERAKLSSGSTWHAAGLVGQLRTNANVTQLLGYSVALYDRLEAETGLATGWKMNGGLRLACNAERWIEVKRQATTAHSFGLEMHLLTPKEAQELWPLMTVDDLVGAAFLPTDGQASPTDIVQALARGARSGGVTIREDTPITGIRVEKAAACAASRRRKASSNARSSSSRRAVVARDRQDGGRQRAARLGAAPVRHHRADRRRAAEPADAARSRPPHLLQGGGRRAGHGRLRAEPHRPGPRTASRKASTSRCSTPTGTISRRVMEQALPRVPALAERRHQAAHQRPGKLHAGRQFHPRRGAGGARHLRRRRLQRLRHRLGRRRRHGARRMGRRRASRRTISGRSTSAASARTTSTSTGSGRARSKPTPSTTRWPGRSRSSPPAARSAARRSTRR